MDRVKGGWNCCYCFSLFDIGIIQIPIEISVPINHLFAGFGRLFVGIGKSLYFPILLFVSDSESIFFSTKVIVFFHKKIFFRFFLWRLNSYKILNQ